MSEPGSWGPSRLRIPRQPAPPLPTRLDIKIYGHSDDCVEIEGYFHAEFTYDPKAWLFLSDMTTIAIVFGADIPRVFPGEPEEDRWRIKLANRGPDIARVVEIAGELGSTDILELYFNMPPIHMIYGRLIAPAKL